MQQKFKRGNLVKVLVGNLLFSNKRNAIDISPEQVGETAVIEGSYRDLIGGNNIDSYQVIFTKTGRQVAWKNTNELEFIEEGGEHLIEEARSKQAK